VQEGHGRRTPSISLSSSVISPLQHAHSIRLELFAICLLLRTFATLRQNYHRTAAWPGAQVDQKGIASLRVSCPSDSL